MKSSHFLLLTIYLLLPYTLLAQSKFAVSEGKVAFSSDAPLELIEAETTSIRGVIEPGSNKFAFAVKISDFEGFNSSLQRSHFNENYMESEEYPNATFAGKIIEDIDYSVDGTHKVRAKGKLTIHGVSQTRLFRATMVIKNGKIKLEASINVPLEDHEISIPTIVSQKIATEIDVTVQATLSPQ